MKTNYVLIDYENVQVKSLALLKDSKFRILVFVGKTNSKIHFDLANDVQKFGERAEYVKLESSGPNALDFHIAFYLGKLVSADPGGIFHVISKDRGYDTLIHRLNSQGIEAVRSPAIVEMPCFAAASTKGAVASKAAVAPIVQVRTVMVEVRKKSKAVGHSLKAAELDSLIARVVENLIGRKAARPGKMKSLLSTVHTLIGKERPVAAAEAVRDALVARKYVVEDGLKVTYKLPKPA